MVGRHLVDSQKTAVRYIGRESAENHVCHCGAVVKEWLARADKPGSTPGDAVFCFAAPFFFFLLSLFF